MAEVAPTESKKNSGWEIIGKVAVIVTIIGGLIAGVIALYDFIDRKAPALVAEVQLMRRSDYIPTPQVMAMSDKINQSYNDKFIASFEKEDYANQRTRTPELFTKFSTFLDQVQNEQRRSLVEFLEIEQAIKVFIENQGQKQADSVSVELPIGTKGYYRIDGLEQKPFEQKIDVGSIRAEKLLLVEIWLRRKTVEAKDVVVGTPDGKVPISEPTPEKSFWSCCFPYLLLIFETVIILILLIKWPKPPQEVPAIE